MRYVTPRGFARMSKGKKVTDYPNPWIKDIDGVCCQIINPDMEYKISTIGKEHYPWYLGMTFEEYAKQVKEIFGDDDARVFALECEWFPTHLVAGVRNGRYNNMTSLSRKSGWIRTFGGMDLFRASQVKTAIAILNKAGFKFNVKEIL